MRIDDAMVAVFTRVRVLELVTAGRDGAVSVHPMSAVWLPERERLMLTTPVAFAQKALNVRRDGRVALLYSDYTGSGLPADNGVLVTGTATAPDLVATPQDIPEYWAASFRRSPGAAREIADERVQREREWYFLRLPMYVTPERVDLLEPTAVGGRFAPEPPEDAPIADALDRYPTAVFAARDATGHPSATRATVSAGDGETLAVRTAQDFPGVPGPAHLLWHRHDDLADMRLLMVGGMVTGAAREWTFTPSRRAASTGDVRDSTRRYLERRGLAWPRVDWAALAALAP